MISLWGTCTVAKPPVKWQTGPHAGRGLPGVHRDDVRAAAPEIHGPVRPLDRANRVLLRPLQELVGNCNKSGESIFFFMLSSGRRILHFSLSKFNYT